MLFVINFLNNCNYYLNNRDLQENEKVVGIEIPDKHSSNFVLFGRKYLKIWIFNQNDNMLEIGLDLKDKLKIENDIVNL